MKCKENKPTTTADAKEESTGQEHVNPVVCVRRVTRRGSGISGRCVLWGYAIDVYMTCYAYESKIVACVWYVLGSSDST
jgi:hypothetical protein